MFTKRNALLAAAVFALGTLASTASAQGASGTTDPQTAQKLSKVHSMTSSTVQVAQLAEKKAHSPAAKSLAKNVVRDWQEVQKQLESMAKQRNITLDPNADPQNAAALQTVTTELNGLNGAEFDKKFVEMEVGGFQNIEQALKDLRDTTTGKDAQLKTWLDKTENKAEASLTQSRNAKTAVANAK